MSNGTALVEYTTDTGKVKLSPSIIKRYLVSGDPEKVTGQELMMFQMLCMHQKLNPFLKEAYLIKYSANEPATMVTGKDVFTKRAAASPLCSGWAAGVVVQTAKGDIQNRDGSMVWSGETILGGWAEIHRKDWKVPLSHTVSIDEYKKLKPNGEPAANWRTMPGTMIRKVALAQALREAFPEDFAGLYTPEELNVDINQLDDKPVKVEVVIDAEVEDEELDTSDIEPDEVPDEYPDTEEPPFPDAPPSDEPPSSKEAEKLFDGKAKPKKKITERQVKRMFGIAKGNADVVKDITKVSGFEKPADVTMDVYEAICLEIEERVAGAL